MTQNLSELLAENKKLKEEIAELNEALHLAIWPKRTLSTKLAQHFNLSAQQASLLTVLYFAKDVLPRSELLHTIPHKENKEEYSISFVNVLVHKIRKHLGKDSILNGANKRGYILSQDFREQISKVRADAQSLR